MDALLTYLPEDRVRALARGMTVPDHSDGATLFADISGFTALTEALTKAFGDKGSFLYAAFGAPIAHDDDLLRAVATALELGSPPTSLLADEVASTPAYSTTSALVAGRGAPRPCRLRLLHSPPCDATIRGESFRARQ